MFIYTQNLLFMTYFNVLILSFCHGKHIPPMIANVSCESSSDLQFGVDKKPSGGVPLWCNRLRIWCCHCRSSGHCYGSWIPGPGNSTCHKNSQKKKRINLENLLKCRFSGPWHRDLNSVHLRQDP